jgi:NAD(P)H dehydrogenase (quinone)
MSFKKILIIQGHPDKESLCFALSAAYKKGATSSGAEIRELNLVDLKFDLILRMGYREIQPLEPDLAKAQECIIWADHIVFVYPTWWVGLPALLKGFVDRVFLPGFAFKYRKNSPFWDKLLKGRSARIITTMDAPKIYNIFSYRSDGHISFRKGTLEFCGVSPVHTTVFGMVRFSEETKRKSWIKEAEKLGSLLV